MGGLVALLCLLYPHSGLSESELYGAYGTNQPQHNSLHGLADESLDARLSLRLGHSVPLAYYFAYGEIFLCLYTSIG